LNIESIKTKIRIMTYHHLRNATAVIETETEHILVDPMLGEVGSIEAFTSKRFPPLRNPLVALPEQASDVLDKITHALITHQHADHLDEAGIYFLKFANKSKGEVICNHLEALNHCPTQRKKLKNNMALDTLWIPEDGTKKDDT
jgi:L-ascorbate metabolism protein UlaG (beta-lactamase superfamily)